MSWMIDVNLSRGFYNRVKVWRATTGFVQNAFEDNDARKINWIKKDFSGFNGRYNYKNASGGGTPQEQSVVLRLAEQYLIRAEARARLDNLTGAANDLNIIRRRARLSNTKAATKTEFLDAIIQERRVELFAEWGNRWFDLKRTRKATTVLGIATEKLLFPIPERDLNTNPNLDQNKGYQ